MPGGYQCVHLVCCWLFTREKTEKYGSIYCMVIGILSVLVISRRLPLLVNQVFKMLCFTILIYTVIWWVLLETILDRPGKCSRLAPRVLYKSSIRKNLCLLLFMNSLMFHIDHPAWSLLVITMRFLLCLLPFSWCCPIGYTIWFLLLLRRSFSPDYSHSWFFVSENYMLSWMCYGKLVLGVFFWLCVYDNVVRCLVLYKDSAYI